jgi:signal peptidase I
MERIRPRIKPRLGYVSSFSISEIVGTLLFMWCVVVLSDMAIPRSLVDGRSMEPTFHDEERLFISRLHYLVQRPERGDVLVFNSMNPREPEIMLIKRVIGLPGDLIELRDQQLYINNQLVQEPYIKEPCTPMRCEDESWQLGRDQYFMMGDNRNNSNDSRVFGPVPIDHIVGRVVLRYWPLDRIGPILHYDYPEDVP